MPRGLRKRVGSTPLRPPSSTAAIRSTISIREVAECVAETQGIPFLYRDFREGWSEGVRISKEMGMYRQPYCGCIYSEKERYCRNIGKEEGGNSPSA